MKEESEKFWLKSQHSENEDHDIQSHHFMANRLGNNGNSDRLFWGAPKSLQMVIAAMKLKYAYSLEEGVMTNLDSILKHRDITLPIWSFCQRYGFSSSHVWI